MATVTTIVHDTAALVRSTVTTLVALAIGVTGLVATVTALDIVPDDKKALLASVAAAATIITTAGRSLIAWLDKNNDSFGRVAVEADPNVDNAGNIQEPDEPEPVVEDVDPIDLPDADNDEVIPVADDAVDEPVDLTLD